MTVAAAQLVDGNRVANDAFWGIVGSAAAASCFGIIKAGVVAAAEYTAVAGAVGGAGLLLAALKIAPLISRGAGVAQANVKKTLNRKVSLVNGAMASLTGLGVGAIATLASLSPLGVMGLSTAAALTALYQNSKPAPLPAAAAGYGGALPQQARAAALMRQVAQQTLPVNLPEFMLDETEELSVSLPGGREQTFSSVMEGFEMFKRSLPEMAAAYVDLSSGGVKVSPTPTRGSMLFFEYIMLAILKVKIKESRSARRWIESASTQQLSACYYPGINLPNLLRKVKEHLREVSSRERPDEDQRRDRYQGYRRQRDRAYERRREEF